MKPTLNPSLKPSLKPSLIPFAFIVLLHLAAPVLATDLECDRWEVVDIALQSGEHVEDPLDASFGAVWTHESGKYRSVPGFYDGEDRWVLRFCPDQEGSWEYETYSSLPGLAGRRGELTVGPVRKPGEHGPLKIHPDHPDRFAYADGSPYFLMAFELDWLFALDHDNPDDIPRTREITSHLIENGFNHVIMNVYANDASWGDRESIRPEHNFARPEVYPFGGTNESPDHSTLNLKFFRHLDRVISHLDSAEIIAHVMIYVWNKKVNWPEPGSEEDNRYFDYVVRRYQAYPNLVWDISKEALQYGRNDLDYITGRIERLRRLDGHGRLLSVHDYGYCSVHPGKVDFISIQDWKPNIYQTMREVALAHPGMPIFNIEHGGYEKSMHSIFDGAYTDALVCLDRNYRIAFAGAYSTYYWQNSSWYEVVWNPSSLPEERRPRFDYFRHMTALFETYPFHSLTPMQSTFTSFVLTDRESVYLIYCTQGMISMQGDMPQLRGKTVDITWFDPLSGRYLPAGSRTFSNGTWLGIGKPADLDAPFAVAILEVRP